MVFESPVQTGTRLSRWGRSFGLATVVAASILGVVATATTANAAPVRGIPAAEGTVLAESQDVTSVPGGKVLRFGTKIQWGGAEAAWHDDADLVVFISNRHGVLGDTPPVGAQLTWSGSNGDANITFFGDGFFSGSARFPKEGPVGYRGTLKAATTPTRAEIRNFARFATEIQWGGAEAPWHADTELLVYISSRNSIVDHAYTPAGTQLTWSGSNGDASLTFFGDGFFSGSARFPKEGPVGYRGTQQ